MGAEIGLLTFLLLAPFHKPMSVVLSFLGDWWFVIGLFSIPLLLLSTRAYWKKPTK